MCKNSELWEESILGESDHCGDKGQDTAAHRATGEGGPPTVKSYWDD